MSLVVEQDSTGRRRRADHESAPTAPGPQGRLRRVLGSVLLVLLVAIGLTGCGDDDDGANPTALPTRLTDPCRLISTAQLRQELGVEFSTRQAGDDPPAGDEVIELSCSWISLDPEVESSEDYLEEDVPEFIDVVVRLTEPSGPFDATELMGEATADPSAVEVPELIATEVDPTLAQAATAVGGTLFLLKGDVLLTVSTESPESLNQLIPGIIERIVRRI